MEAFEEERESIEEIGQYRHQEALADARDREHALELSYLIDGVDVVDALEAVEIALMDGIQAQEAGLALGVGLAPLGDL